MTTYEYYTLNQLTKRVTPDADTTEFKYDKNGNLRFSWDANQGKLPVKFFCYIRRP
ncbi:hypothetical protein IIC38_18585 [candidate division KSB1 bacterium]|nr:hypothetical protein [candidate division KSB1 bacterium]